MVETVSCPNPSCLKSFELPAERIGLVNRCRHCGEMFTTFARVFQQLGSRPTTGIPTPPVVVNQGTPTRTVVAEAANVVKQVVETRVQEVRAVSEKVVASLAGSASRTPAPPETKSPPAAPVTVATTLKEVGSVVKEQVKGHIGEIAEKLKEPVVSQPVVMPPTHEKPSVRSEAHTYSTPASAPATVDPKHKPDTTLHPPKPVVVPEPKPVQPTPVVEKKKPEPVVEKKPAPVVEPVVEKKPTPVVEPAVEKKPTPAPEPKPEPPPRYRLLQRLRKVGFGEIHRGLDTRMGKEVTLICHPKSALPNGRAVDLFLERAGAAAQLEHPHLVPIHEAGCDGAIYYIVSHFPAERTLDDLLKAERLEFRHISRLVRDVASGLAYGHQRGLVHREVRPETIWLNSDDVPLLMGFGLPHESDLNEASKTVLSMEQLPYIAPEQLDSKTVGTKSSDQYSLGVLLYLLLTGQLPFLGPVEELRRCIAGGEFPMPHTLEPYVPQPLEAICLRMLARKPQDRFPDCKQVADELQHWLDMPRIIRNK